MDYRYIRCARCIDGPLVHATPRWVLDPHGDNLVPACLVGCASSCLRERCRLTPLSSLPDGKNLRPTAHAWLSGCSSSHVCYMEALLLILEQALVLPCNSVTWVISAFYHCMPQQRLKIILFYLCLLRCAWVRLSFCSTAMALYKFTDSPTIQYLWPLFPKGTAQKALPSCNSNKNCAIAIAWRKW